MAVPALGAIQTSRPPEIVIPRRRGSRTPRPFGSITAASGILDPRRSLSSGGHSADPVAGMTAGYDFAISRHVLPEVCLFICPLSNPRAQGRPGARCTRGLVCSCAHEDAHTSIQVQRKHSGLPCAVALRLTSCSPQRTALLPLSPRKARAFAQLDASTATSGPHDFAVRNCHTRQSWHPRPPHLTARS